jgi:hypothetical protein
MERKCQHGVGHPDPDHIDFVRRSMGDAAARMESNHNCDGCCKLAMLAHEDQQLIQAAKRLKLTRNARKVVDGLCVRLEQRTKEALSSQHVWNLFDYDEGDDPWVYP